MSYLENGKREPTISLLLLLVEKKGVDISYWFTPEGGDLPINTKAISTDMLSLTKGSQDQPTKLQITNIEHMSFPEIIVLQAQIRVYLDNIKKPILDYDRRMLLNILAACQRAVNSEPSERIKAKYTLVL